MQFDLTGKVALITGATRGLGQEIAFSVARAGADVVVVSRNEADCRKAASEIESFGSRALASPCDVTRPDLVAHLVGSTMKEFGKIDILVNNAGIALTKPSEDITEKDWDAVVDTNLKAVFFLSQAVGREMIRRKSGKIINIGSIFGLVGAKSITPYLASKGGVVQITKGLALEWAKYNIQVNCIAPGYIMTSMNREELSEEKTLASIIGRIPMRRLGLPSDISGAVVYLASDAASYVTGTVLCADGGWLAQ
jgi:NAD(P)-dependent dehydrogenase (short-subunit alcohol dehydrogenase family)